MNGFLDKYIEIETDNIINLIIKAKISKKEKEILFKMIINKVNKQILI